MFTEYRVISFWWDHNNYVAITFLRLKRKPMRLSAQRFPCVISAETLKIGERISICNALIIITNGSAMWSTNQLHICKSWPLISPIHVILSLDWCIRRLWSTLSHHSKLFCFFFAVSTCIGDFVRVCKLIQFFVESIERYLALFSSLYHFKIAYVINSYHIAIPLL